MSSSHREKLLKLIDKVRDHLKKDEIMKEIFKKYNVDIDELNYYPMCFSKIPVSARTQKSVIYFNSKLIKGGIEAILPYAIHECTHILQQTCAKKPTKSSAGDNYLENKKEIEAFQNQVKFIANSGSEENAEEYVDKLLDYHELRNSKRDRKKKQLMKKIEE